MPRLLSILPILMIFTTSCSKQEVKRIERLDNKSPLWQIDDSIEKPFREAVDLQLPPLDSVEGVLTRAFKNKNIRFCGVIIPYNRPVIIQDSIIFIGLNHYLGSESNVYAGFPEYLRRGKTIKRLPVDAVNEYLIRTRYAEGLNARETVLSYLLYAGALYNQTIKMLPKNTSEALILNMTDDEYDWCRQNEQRIWNSLIENNLLYSSDPDIIAKLFADSPKSTLINANAPGNTPYYIALKLVQAYERNTSREARPTPEFINSTQTLIDSKYAPQNATR